MIQLCNNAYNDMYKRIKTCLRYQFLVVKINFALPIKSEKQNAVEAMVPDLLKFF